MRVIYVTTSIEENDYVDFSKAWSISLNPSNQNFHNKVIRSLAAFNKVDVFSIRPYSRSKCHLKKLPAENKTIGNINYHYLRIARRKYFRGPSLNKQVKKLMPSILDDKVVLVTDTINPRCIQLTSYIKKTFDIPCLGICTDSPFNISWTNHLYTSFLMNNARHLDGYICLTEGLNELYNKHDKPFIKFEGIVDSFESKQDIQGKYFFFGGALLKRYGIYELLEAFKRIKNKDLSLLVCGHHAEEDLEEVIEEDNRVKYLGTLPVKEVLQLENHAIANINPRPYDEQLDRFSVPSKTIEYLSSGSITISVRNSELQNHFSDCAIWINSNDIEDLEGAMKKALSISENERKKIAEKAKKTAKSLYSIEKIGKLLTDFLLTFIQ